MLRKNRGNINFFRLLPGLVSNTRQTDNHNNHKEHNMARKTSNKHFEFRVVVSPKDDLTQTAELRLTSSGSQETRARRRLLNSVYHGGCIVRNITLLNTTQG